MGKGHEGVPRYEVGGGDRSPGGDDACPPADGGSRVPGARTARLRSRRHAASSGWSRAGDRSQSKPVAQLTRRVRNGGAEVGSNLYEADRGDRRTRPRQILTTGPNGRASSQHAGTSLWPNAHHSRADWGFVSPGGAFHPSRRAAVI